MYYDDRYHPTADPDEMSVGSTSTFTTKTNNSSVRRHRRNVADEIKRSDKGYCSYQHRVVSANGVKTHKVEMFDSGTCIGNRIRDPMSGARMYDRIGSKNEYQYFKVRMAGFKPGKSVTLYYDSPEQFERHHKCQLSTTTKEKWIQNKCNTGNSD
jgi:hypothetical protein